MDIQKMKYNQELMKYKISLQKKLNMINVELMELQKDCKHIYAIVGKENEYVSNCLFCDDKKVGKIEDGVDSINAITYRRATYSDGYNENQRLGRLTDLQELVIKYLEENEKITNSEIIAKLDDVIVKDEERNKIMEKSRINR